MSDQPWTPAELMFGRRTGRHSHPATHRLWLEFSEDDWPVCGPPQEARRSEAAGRGAAGER